VNTDSAYIHAYYIMYVTITITNSFY